MRKARKIFTSIFNLGSFVFIFAAISIGIYYFLRIYFFAKENFSFWDHLFGSLLILAETYMIIHSLGFILSIYRLKKRRFIRKIQLREYPEVAVLVAARHEPGWVLEQTFVALNLLDYPNKKLYLLDGSDREEFLKQDKELAKKYGIEFFHPQNLPDTKAGMINAFVREMKGEYLVVFDADQNPFPDFLEKTVSIAEADKKIAFVQTPQFYANTQVSPIARGAEMQQAIFFESVCESKSTVNAIFCCGTNFLMRKKPLIEAGGFDEKSVTEDFATSFKIHLLGYKSVYYNHVRVFGMAPESLPAYFKQQFRWAAGTIGVLKKFIQALFSSPGKMKVSQWWEYFLSSSYYLIGWAFFFLMLCPIVFLLWGVPSYFLSPYIYLGAFAPYFLITTGNFYVTMKKRNYGISEAYNGVVLGSLSFPVLMSATLSGLFGKKLKFQITPKGESGKLGFWQLSPWTLMMALNLLAIFWGIRNIEKNIYAFSINIFWCLYHLAILFQIFRFNERPKIISQALFKNSP